MSSPNPEPLRRIVALRSLRALREQVRRVRSRSTVRSAEIGFIVSTGRTGTKFWESLLQSHPRVVCVHEPSPDLFDLGVAKFRTKGTGQRISTFPYRYKPILEAHHQGKAYIESNPFLSLLIAELAHELPSARFLWVTRDPVTYLPSAYSKSPDGSGSMYFYGDDDWRQRLTAEDLPGDVHAADWPDLDRFERICWYWNACNSLISEQLSTLDLARVHRVSFESLFGPDDEGEVRGVADFFEFRLPPDLTSDLSVKVNENPRQLLESTHDWSMARRKRFNQLTRPMRETLGYPEA